MVRFLEREGFDVTFCTDVDTHARGHLLLLHKGFLSVGHDEYWSWEMRDNVEAARDAGVSLGFFGANASFFQIRFQPGSLPGTSDGAGRNGARERTIVCYKSYDDPLFSRKNPPWLRRRTTVQFRLPPVDRPEDALVGVMYRSYLALAQKADIVVEDASNWIFENTGLSNGDRLPGLLGYECDQIFGNAPPGTKRIAHSPYQDYFGESLHSDMVSYTSASGATVVATGSMQWNWGLDDFIFVFDRRPIWTNPAVQQATRNILNRFIGSGSRRI